MGTRPVKLFRTRVQGRAALLALSSRSYLTYAYQGRIQTAPLACVRQACLCGVVTDRVGCRFDTLDYATPFSSEQCPEGFCAISGNQLRYVLSLCLSVCLSLCKLIRVSGTCSIVATERLSDVFHQRVIPLTYTPRKALRYPDTPYLVVIESDHNVSSRDSRDRARTEEKMDVDAAPAAAAAADNPTDRDVGAPQAGMGRWASVVRLVDGAGCRTLHAIELDDNEAAVSLALVQFPEKSAELFVVVGTARDMSLHPRRASAGALRLYRVVSGQLELVHMTPIDDMPYALAAFQGRLLAGVGKALRLYELGKKKLLRKCENRNFPNFIQSLTVHGERVVVGDIQESFMFVKYRRTDNTFVVFADTTQPRWLTAQTLLDYDTMAGADKFGMVFSLSVSLCGC
jgi:splicing factor 3B subunit 3